jgi:diguanylate cyclase (GGDEF)-like protein
LKLDANNKLYKNKYIVLSIIIIIMFWLFDPFVGTEMSHHSTEVNNMNDLNSRELSHRIAITIAVLLFGIYFQVKHNRLMSIKDALRTAKEEAEQFANIDFLTGCLNRRFFLVRLDEEISRAKRKGLSTGLILVDIDHFKKVNDTYGHLTGDEVLKFFYKFLTNFLRPYDFIGRFGGEEFMICLPDTDGDGGVEIALRMQKALAETIITIPPLTVKITASFGVVTVNYNSTETLTSLISKADQAMYAAKENRNSVYIG